MHSHLDFPVLGMSSQGNNPDGADAVPMNGMGADAAVDPTPVATAMVAQTVSNIKFYAIGALVGFVAARFMYKKK